MSIKSAYRRLYKHRFRWKIVTTFDPDNFPAVCAELRDESLWPDCAASPCVYVCHFGLEAGWKEACRQIEDRNRIIEAYQELQKLTRDAELEPEE